MSGLSRTVKTVKGSMLKPVRIAAGFRQPSTTILHNVESHNNVIKQHTKDAAQELPEFVEEMKGLIATQKEIERAVIGMGEYRLANTFKSIAVDKYKYFQMSEEQWEKVPKQVLNVSFLGKCGECILGEMEASDVESMGRADENPLIQISIPQYVAERVWTEGKELALQDSNMYFPWLH